MGEFDFDHWCELALREPERYYRERERVISAFIDAHPEDTARKLRELQAHVDATRAVAGAPLQATRQLLGLIDERLEAMRDRMLELQAENDRIAAALRRLS